MIRHGKWKYVHYVGLPPMLFDLEADPAEKTTLADQQPEVVSKLQTKLRDWQQSVLKSLTSADYAK